MPHADDHSLLLTQLWDIRATMEDELRRLTTAQRSVGDFSRSADPDKQDHLRTKILRDLQDIEELSSTLVRMITPAIEQAHAELTV